MSDKSPHIPVMLNEVLENMAIKPNSIYIDCTFGNGGYTKAILDSFDSVKVIAFDRDINVIPKTEELKKIYGERFIFVNEKFSNVLKSLLDLGYEKNSIDGMVLDIGVSSMQIDNAERGFSFRFNSPISMAMGKNDLDAKEVLNNYPEGKLADIFYQYGEEKKSRFIAKRIVKFRENQQIETTGQLVGIIEDCVGKFGATKVIPRIFQALRIYVNNELGELSTILGSSEDILKSNGRLVVVDFHSLEDRIVKNFMKEKTKINANNSRYMPNIKISENNKNLSFKTVQKNAILPSDEEVEQNPRARSAKLRVIEKV